MCSYFNNLKTRRNKYIDMCIQSSGLLQKLEAKPIGQIDIQI